MIPPNYPTVYVGSERREALLVGIGADGKHALCRGVPLVDGAASECVPWPDVFWSDGESAPSLIDAAAAISSIENVKVNLLDRITTLEGDLAETRALAVYREEALRLLEPGDDEDYKDRAVNVMRELRLALADVRRLQRDRRYLEREHHRMAQKADLARQRAQDAEALVRQQQKTALVQTAELAALHEEVCELGNRLRDARRRSWIDHIRTAVGALLQRIRGARR